MSIVHHWFEIAPVITELLKWEQIWHLFFLYFARAVGVTHIDQEYPTFGRRDAATLQKLPQDNRPSGC